MATAGEFRQPLLALIENPVLKGILIYHKVMIDELQNLLAVPDPDLEIREGGGGGCPLGPSPGSATVLYHFST